MKVQGQIPPSTGYTLFYCSSLYRASQMCFLQIETGPSTSKRTTTRFIGALWNRTRGIAKLCLELFLGRKTVALGDLICHLSRQWRHRLPEEVRTFSLARKKGKEMTVRARLRTDSTKD